MMSPSCYIRYIHTVGEIHKYLKSRYPCQLKWCSSFHSCPAGILHIIWNKFHNDHKLSKQFMRTTVFRWINYLNRKMAWPSVAVCLLSLALPWWSILKQRFWTNYNTNHCYGSNVQPYFQCDHMVQTGYMNFKSHQQSKTFQSVYYGKRIR